MFDRLLLGAGAMKAGTTWLYAMLDQHPEIYFSYEKEVHYFYARHVDASVLSETARLAAMRDKYLRDTPGARARDLRQKLRWVANYLDGPVDDLWYRNLFSFRSTQSWVADFSNLHALLPPEAWVRIASQCSELKVIYTMRDPAQRLWSHLHFHLVHSGQAEALAQWSPERALSFLRQDFLWDHAEYGRALRAMQAGLPPGALHIAWFEDCHADPATGLAAITDHLGLGGFAPRDQTRRINAGAAAPMPEWFARGVARDVARIIREVEAQGFSPPESWWRGQAVLAA